MLTFKDHTKDIDEQKSERLEVRTMPSVNTAITKAAALAGTTKGTFVTQAAYALAMKTIAAHERTLLQPVDHAVFFDALENPPAPNDKLQAVFEGYQKKIASK